MHGAPGKPHVRAAGADRVRALRRVEGRGARPAPVPDVGLVGEDSEHAERGSHRAGRQEGGREEYLEWGRFHGRGNQAPPRGLGKADSIGERVQLERDPKPKDSLVSRLRWVDSSRSPSFRNPHGTVMTDQKYDAIVIGSGIS